jgi:hypothetical protein
MRVRAGKPAIRADHGGGDGTMPVVGAALDYLAGRGMVGLGCATSISRRSFMGIANGRRRPKAAAGQPAAAASGFDPKLIFDAVDINA